ncbi:MAG: hypothetical protein AB1697_07970 [Pseudomonadota bacterium]
MIRLPRTLAAWGQPEFRQALKQELAALDADQLPLQQGMARGSQALADGHEAVLLGVTDLDGCLQARVGLFFASRIAGCSCADDPTPLDEANEYCVVQLDIDKRTAETTVRLLPD